MQMSHNLKPNLDIQHEPVRFMMDRFEGFVTDVAQKEDEFRTGTQNTIEHAFELGATTFEGWGGVKFCCKVGIIIQFHLFYGFMILWTILRKSWE